MRIRFLAVFLVLTVALFGMGFYFLNRLSSEISPPAKPVANENLREKLNSLKNKPAPEKRNSATQPQVVYVTNQFRWSEIESDDYRKYIANLRAVGCPENTIKDIILTDVMKLFAARRGQFAHNGREFRFWETDEKRKLNTQQLEEQERQLAAIDKELPSVLRELLGINYQRELSKYFVDANEDERRLNFIPAEKREQLLALREKIEGMRERILEGANGNLSAADFEALRKIEEEQRAGLKKILSDTEVAEFELRMSPVADRLRAELIGFNPSKEEFRLFFELQNTVEENFAFANPNDPNVIREKTAMQKDVEQEIGRQLGEARYAEYERAKNPDFRDTCVFTEVYGLPQSTARTLFEIKQIAEAEKANLMRNSTLSEYDRWETMRSFQAEIETSLQQTLGAKTFSAYNESAGKWIQNLR